MYLYLHYLQDIWYPFPCCNLFAKIPVVPITSHDKYFMHLTHMMHDLGWVILSLFSVTVLQVLHGVTQYQWHILVT